MLDLWNEKPFALPCRQPGGCPPSIQKLEHCSGWAQPRKLSPETSAQECWEKT